MYWGLIRRVCFNASRYRLQQYGREDYMTMCGLLRQKYQRNNQQIQTSGLIKLLDDSGKVLGIYSASQARKKAAGMNMDMVLVTLKTTPPVCKVSNFRQRVLNRFYQEVVLKKQQELLIKASTVKNLKVAPTLNQKQLSIKLKQIIELAQKNMKVRVYMVVKVASREEGLSKLQWIKSELMNHCYLQEEITSSREQAEDEEEEDEKTVSKKSLSYSFVVKARDNNLVKKSKEDKKLQPEAAIRQFLKDYYRQDEGEMMDLKSAGLFEIEGDEQIETTIKVQTVEKDEVEEQSSVDEGMLRQAKARVLNSRLKTMLELYK